FSSARFVSGVAPGQWGDGLLIIGPYVIGGDIVITGNAPATTAARLISPSPSTILSVPVPTPLEEVSLVSGSSGSIFLGTVPSSTLEADGCSIPAISRY